MPTYEIKVTTEELTEFILRSIIEEIKHIDSIPMMTPEAKMRMFNVYFRGLKDGLSVASKGLLDQERMKDPIISIITDNIIGGIISGRLSDRQGWLTMLSDIVEIQNTIEYFSYS